MYKISVHAYETNTTWNANITMYRTVCCRVKAIQAEYTYSMISAYSWSTTEILFEHVLS